MGCQGLGEGPDYTHSAGRLQPADPDSPVSISTRVIGTGPVPDTAYWFSVALSNLREDNYDLKVTVKDVRSNAEVTRTTAFTVLED